MQVCTTLIHRATRGDQPWWRFPTVYEFLGMLDERGVRAATDALDTVAQLGAELVVIRPAWVDLDTASDVIAAFIDRVHALGMRVSIRMSGAVTPVTGKRDTAPVPFTGYEIDTDTALARARRFLELGADGLDLGMFIETQMSPGDPQVSSTYLTQTLNQLRAEIAAFPPDGDGRGLERIILAGAVSTSLPLMMRQRLLEHLLHHLRDDSLVRTPFEAGAMRQWLTQVVTERDKLGVSLAWYASPGFIRTRTSNPAGRIGWYSVTATDQQKCQRSQAMDLVLMALPGAVYLHGGDEIGILDESHPIDESDPRGSEAERIRFIAEQARAQATQVGSPYWTHQQAAKLRGELGLNRSTLAWVEQESWDADQILAIMSGQVLVVLNTSDSPVSLRPQWEQLLSSTPLERDPAGGWKIPGGAAAWFELKPEV